MATVVIVVKENTRNKRNAVAQSQNTDCFAIQVGGSVENYEVDNNFVTARFITEEQEMSFSMRM